MVEQGDANQRRVEIVTVKLKDLIGGGVAHGGEFQIGVQLTLNDARGLDGFKLHRGFCGQ